MYVLYMTNKNYSSWSLRPWVLMQTLGIAFEERLVPLGAPSSHHVFRKFAPNGKVPCLHDGMSIVWESLAITEYLAERHEGLWPADPDARAFARSAAAEMHSGFNAVRRMCAMSCGVRVRLRRIEPNLREDLQRMQALWQSGLRRFGGPYLAGANFSAADAFFAPVAFRIQTYALALTSVAMTYAYRLLELPAMRRWYEAALAETWRDEAHEREILEHGVVLEDLRHSTLHVAGVRAQNA